MLEINKTRLKNIHTWFGVDKSNLVAIFYIYPWGWVPNVLLKNEQFEIEHDILVDYTCEDSIIYTNYPKRKNGKTIVDLHSYHQHGDSSKEEIQKKIDFNLSLPYKLNLITATTIPARKGYFVYQTVAGEKTGDDYPIGYNGPTDMGDYFRFGVPTELGNIDDLHPELWHIVAASDTLDFSKDRVIRKEDINKHFTHTYRERI